jgi:PKD repeat protein
MKKITNFCYVFILLSFLAVSTSRAGLVFSDDFDDYTGSIPWEGEGNWVVTEASVDLIGEGTSWDLLPGNGLYLDMDGSTGNAGTIESIDIELAPGDYILSFDVAGNQRNKGDDSIEVLVGGGSLVSTTTTVGQDSLFTTVTIPFTVAEQTKAAISFNGDGGDNAGLLLDNVSVATADSLNTGGISFEVPFISQIDHRWSDMTMLGQDQDGDPQTVDFHPEDVNYAECGDALAAVSMILEYYRESTANWLGLTPVPPEVDEFLNQYNAHRSVAGGTGCTAVEVDMSPLMYWDRIDVDGSIMYSGLRLESQPWGIVSKLRLDADLKEYKPHILEVDGPISGGGGKTGLDTHYLVVAGWDEQQQSYLVHDSLIASSEVYWNASNLADGASNPPVISLSGAVYTEPQRTLHDLYFGKDPMVEPGGLNVITRVIFVEPVVSSEAAGALKIYATGPVELYVGDPDGKRVGTDPVSGSHVEEADAYYYTQGGASPFSENCCNSLVKVVEFPRPKEGMYLIQVVGSGDGDYNLFSNMSEMTFSGKVGVGQIDKFELEYSQDGLASGQTENFLPKACAVSSTTSAGIGIPISFSGLTSNDFDGIVVSFNWDFGDGATATGVAAEHVYTVAGDYMATLTVEDDLGGTDTGEVEISIIEPTTPQDPGPPSVMIVRKQEDGSIVNLAPFIALASTESNSQAQVDLMALGISPADGDVKDWKWKWDFGDGTAPSEYSYLPGGVGEVTHEYAEPGSYTVTVVFNNGIEDSPPAAAQIEILPALARNGEQFAIDGTCYSAGSQIRADGRVAYSDIPELWDGGFALGEQSLERWLNEYDYELGEPLPLYYLLVGKINDDVQWNWWVLGGIGPDLPDLSFDYIFWLPDDMPEGQYQAVFIATRDLFRTNAAWQQWATAEFPLRIEYPLREVTGLLLGRRIPFIVSCPEPENYLPVADAGGPYQAIAGQPLTLDGTGSYDPDGDDDALTFKWFLPILDFAEPIEVPLPLEGPNPQVIFDAPGVYIITLAVEDEQGDISYSTIGSPGSFAVVKVIEGTPAAENHPPIASAGNNQIIEQDSHAGGSAVLNGSSSSDPDGDPLTYTWTWEGNIATGKILTVVLPLGTTTITLVVNDGKVNSDPDTVNITVQDTTDPVIHSIWASPTVLSPVNCEMVPVTVSVDASDICDPAPACYITGVDVTDDCCPEPDCEDLGITAKGLIKKYMTCVTGPDWELTDDPLVVLLRAKRKCSYGRLYTIHVVCEDRSGNTTSGTVEVTVPGYGK